MDITTPKVSVINKSQFEEEFPKPHVAVHVTYVDGFEGINSLVIKTRDAQVIADLMLGGEGNPAEEELNEIHISAVQEAMNQMMGSSATSMSTIFNRFVNISPPGIDILNMANGEGVNNLPQDETLIKISFRLIIGDLIDSTIMRFPFIFQGYGAHAYQWNGRASACEAVEAPVSTQEPAQAPANSVNGNDMGQGYDYGQGYGQPMQGQGGPIPQSMPYGQPQMAQQYGGMPNRNVNVQPVQFANLQSAPYTQVDENNLNLLMDIPLKSP